MPLPHACRHGCRIAERAKLPHDAATKNARNCIFSVILHRSFLTYASMPAKFLYNLTKNLSAQSARNICALLPLVKLDCFDYIIFSRKNQHKQTIFVKINEKVVEYLEIYCAVILAVRFFTHIYRYSYIK